MDKKLKSYLEKYGIKYVMHKHPAVFTVEESKELKKDIPGLHCKTLFLKDNFGKYYLVGMPAEKRLDNKRFLKNVNSKKARFGNPEELKDIVNLVPGSVSIFGAIYVKDKETKLIIDKEVWEADIVGFHPNVNTSTLVFSHQNLEKFYNSLMCEKEIVEL
jgi:Ala-tRNA(Pro) deacylase